MKKSITVLGLFLSFFALAQMGQGKRGGDCHQASSNYDTTLEETFTGSIQSINKGDRLSIGQYTFVLENSAAVGLTFGPPRYLQQLGIALAVGDTLQVTGVVTTNAAGNQILITRTFSLSGKDYSVRDENGIPLWRKGNKSQARNSKKGHGKNNCGGNGGQQGTCLLQYLATTPLQELSEEETASLILLREEEKLARDVYIHFADLYDLRIFSNISRSEQKHMDAVKILLDRYEVSDPIADDTPGQFSSETIANLYTALTESGSASLAAALQVGATIEDLDIFDLVEGLELSDNTDIDMVYQNLMKGSRNHLRAYVTQLTKQGESYTAQYLTQQEIDDIANSPRERGVIYDADGNQLEGCSNRRSGGGRGRGQGNKP